jgi:2-C-methyl-D-erythritol 4-phosphate cytidylyltransferase
MTRQYVIIVAGGVGKRMSGNLPKQFLMLGDKPILLHTIARWTEFQQDIPIILVIPQTHHATWTQIAEQFDVQANITIVYGGSERFHSVQNALQYIPDDVLVAIHDAVRPCVSVETIASSFAWAEKYGSAVPYTVPQASMRIEKNDGSNISLNREALRIIQTPQTFLSNKLKRAYQQPFQDDFTDDATVWERVVERVFLFEGNSENIKITTDSDFVVLKGFLSTLLNENYQRNNRQ